ncbi:MAG: copper-binding protein [Acidiferrobacteraceae bacterium]|nr:copper-binding protein [Acidiferrobacteraceae bacterium]MBT3638780.1 copper-binding protein [Acidiferrobacteraceae bacterium]MBT3769031.1 copper-binding protein [Acidiferrobacteraceae bacterium]MBT3973851.1 copper-binding protein [Acidiferrobacteraceae bacterium]MBT4405642.1 copper-binding protein [Acidiferrobacteraceae bacterium]
MLTTVVMLISVMAVGEVVMAEGNLSRRPVALPELELATQDGFGISQTEYQMETGKAYKLEIRSTGIEECAFRADEFFRNIWLRKVEAGGLEIKAAQLNELEFETEAEVEIFFVPIKPGRYPYGCKGLEDRGLSGLFIVR